MSDKLKRIKNRIDPSKLTIEQRRTQIKVELILLAILIAVFAFVAYEDYKERPGLLSPDEVVATERTPDSITLSWEDNRNTSHYVLFYKKKGLKYKEWTRVVIEDNDDKPTTSYTIQKLEEGTNYRVVVRADNKDRRGFVTEGKYYSTKSTQTISARDSYSKWDNSADFYIKATAQTGIEYASSDESVATVNKTSGKVHIKKAGNVNIKLTAPENYHYTAATRELSIIVIPHYSANPNSSTHIVYSLDKKNCSVAKRITGSGSATVPQGLAYTGDKYIVAFGMSGSQRIVTFDVEGDGKSVSVPKIALGHPNGFTYSDRTGLCYSVKGWSTRAVTYNPKTGEYSTMNFKYGCSGIGYDRAKKVFYTSSRTAMRTYSSDGKYTHLNAVGTVNHSGKVYTQDCGGHAGIMFHCLSGANKSGTNYIDLYDMVNNKYIGTFKCELNEIESAIVNNDGYLEILSNTSGKETIFKTPINIEDLAEGL